MEKLRGHQIELINQNWVYSDTGELSCIRRPCGHCGLEDTPEGHDGCLGTLPGVRNACCGHGCLDEAYIQFNNKTDIRGQKVIDYLKKWKS